MIILPAIDIKDGRWVRLYQGDYAAITSYDADPVEVAQRWQFAGASWVHIVDLDGAARDIDYLLVNVLDPNRVVGQPYYTRFVVLKNGRVETGLLAAEDPQSITLKTENDALKVIPCERASAVAASRCAASSRFICSYSAWSGRASPIASPSKNTSRCR